MNNITRIRTHMYINGTYYTNWLAWLVILDAVLDVSSAEGEFRLSSDIA